MTPAPPFVRRVRIRNYKSIELCDVELGSLTVLVGRNGAGKSNFLDAMRFVSDALRQPLGDVLRERGGIEQVQRRPAVPRLSFEIGFELLLDRTSHATYQLEISSQRRSGFKVEQESLEIRSAGGAAPHHYCRTGSAISSASILHPPPVADDWLYLNNAAGWPEFRAAYDALKATQVYHLHADEMRQAFEPQPDDLLQKSGRNFASILRRLKDEQLQSFERIAQYLGAILPALREVDILSAAGMDVLDVVLERGESETSRFPATSISAGTLLALGILVAIGQTPPDGKPMRFVGIEEPENALHPAAARVLMDALREASARTQIAVTTHSPDLLDHMDLNRDLLLAVEMSQGSSRIGRVDGASREAIRSQLYLPGELLRLGQLAVDREHLAVQEASSGLSELDIGR